MWYVYGFKGDKMFATRMQQGELGYAVGKRKEAGWQVFWRPAK